MKNSRAIALVAVLALIASLAATASTQSVFAASKAKVDVVVAGYINHGPMQPTVNAIKEVTAKYGDKVSVTWIDSATSEGQAYYNAHGLSAHMNVIINGKSTYHVNGKDVTFQWFEGQQWTKADLDAVLSNLISTKSSPSASANVATTSASSTNRTNTSATASPNSGNSAPSTPGFEAIFAIAGIVAVALIIKRMK